jgi:hypothetical protein
VLAREPKLLLMLLLMPLLFIQIHPMELLLSIFRQMYSIEVYSIIGQKIFSAENTTKSEITIPNIARGTYLVRISTNQESVIKLIIIN